MEKIKEKLNWKAAKSSPVATKQKNNNSIRNQITSNTGDKNPLETVIVAGILLAIVGFFLFFVNEMS
ncbi:MAG: hypothetical protein WBB27_10235 [Maribacter sp.]